MSTTEIPGDGTDQDAVGSEDQAMEEDTGVQPAATVATDGAAPPSRRSADLRVVLVSSITVDLPNQHPQVLLRETETPRRSLTFSVAFQDAVVLSHALRRIPTPRPLTPELVTAVFHAQDIDVVAVRLVGRQGSTLFAELDLRGRTGRSVHSCRPSDALAIALHQPVPVPLLVDDRLFAPGDVEPR